MSKSVISVTVKWRKPHPSIQDGNYKLTVDGIMHMYALSVVK